MKKARGDLTYCYTQSLKESISRAYEKDVNNSFKPISYFYNFTTVVFSNLR